MPAPYLFDLDRLGASRLLLLTFLGIGLVAAFLFQVGLVGWVLKVAGLVLRASVRAGFRLWRRLLAWARWPVFLAVVGIALAAGIVGGRLFPPLALACGTALLFLAAATCLAYVLIDLERYEVARGFKAIHDPLPGQELAVNLVRYGSQVGMPLLGAAALGVVGGFALLNQGLYETAGRSWYRLGQGGVEPDYADFLAYTLINLFGVVDLLHLASPYLHASYVQPAKWPASTLLTIFKSFFTVVLLQQIFASVRRGKLLSETIADFWSPQPAIQERARGALPQHGPGAVLPLLRSLRLVPMLTAEQREYLPRVITDVGPAAIPALTRHLRDSSENVRVVSVAALGCLHALDAVPKMVPLLCDHDERVRQALVEALGAVGSGGGKAVRRRRSLRRALRSSGNWLERVLRRQRRGLEPPTDHLALAVTTLRSAVKDPSAAVRASAARSLGLLGSLAAPSAPDLINLLHDKDEATSLQATEALGRVGGPIRESVAALVGLLAAPSSAVRVAAIGALGAMKKEAADAVASLTPLLQDADEAVRTATAQAIGSIGTLEREAVKDLTEGLSSKDTLVRARTAEALGAIGEAAADAAPALAEALTDSNDRVRAKAAQALGQMGEAAADAVPHLVRALRDEDTWVSALAAEALGEIGGGAADAVPALIRSLRHANPEVRANAAGAIGKMGAAARGAVPALIKAARDSEAEVRVQAVAALGEAGGANEDAGQALLSALQDDSPGVRANAVEALGRREDVKGAGDALLRAAEDVSDEVKARVPKALARVAGATPLALGALCKLLRESGAPVQIETAQALGRLGQEAAPAGEDLLRLTRLGEAAVREQALRALAIIQPPEAAEAFLAGLKDARPEIRMVASAGLIKAAEIAPETVSALVGTLRDPEAQVRANAARVLSRLEPLPSEAIAPLAHCAADPDDEVRLNAALALRSIPPGQAIEAFRHWLADSNPRVRLLASGTLLKAGLEDAEATSTLGHLLNDPAPRIRRGAMELIGSLGADGGRLLAELQRRAQVEIDPQLSGLLDELIERMEQRKTKTEAPVAPDRIDG